MKLQTIHGQPSWVLKSDLTTLCLTRLGGHMAPVEFRIGKRIVAPYSIAPWAMEKLPANLVPILRALRGDFFCMPFGDNALPYNGKKYPPHGETANSIWKLSREESNTDHSEAEWQLNTKIRKGRVRKIIRLRRGETMIYSRHIIEGMSGPMSMGHHASLLFPSAEASGTISTSPFRVGQTFPRQLENPAMGGYSCLKPGTTFTALEKVKMADGGIADLSKYPARPGFEDIVILAGASKAPFAWTAVTFPKERYVWFGLKDPQVLTSTLLWISNGGRHYAPWNGRHKHVMGLEEITSYFHVGLADSAGNNSLKKRGIKTALVLDPKKPLAVNYIMGVAAIPPGFDKVKTIDSAAGGIILHARSGRKAFAKVDLDFLHAKESD